MAHLSIYPFNYLVSIYYVAGTVLCAGDLAVGRTDGSASLWTLHSQGLGGQSGNKSIDKMFWAREETKAEKEAGVTGGGSRKSSKKVPFEQELVEAIMCIYEEWTIPGRGRSRCKGPEVSLWHVWRV